MTISCSEAESVSDFEIKLALARLDVHACERCKVKSVLVKLISAMTAYTDPKENRALWLCPECAEEYRDYWTAMWDEYNRSRG